MKKSLLYTGTGDNGTTSLVGGSRVDKDCARLEAYGTLDEFSSHLGVVSANPQCDAPQKEMLLGIQNLMFDLGCYLATEMPEGEQKNLPDSIDGHIARLEHAIDELDDTTPKVRAFVLPGGSVLAAQTHVARTACRRAERRILTLSRQAYVDPRLMRYINRLSDYLFILARHFNHIAGVPEITWHP